MLIRTIDANASRLAQFNGLTRDTLLTLANEARNAGYAHTRGEVLADVGGIGVPIRNPAGHAVAALNIATTVTRLPPDRVRPLLKLLRTEVDVVERKLQAEFHITE